MNLDKNNPYVSIAIAVVVALVLGAIAFATTSVICNASIWGRLVPVSLY